MQSLGKISQQTSWQILGKAVTSLSTYLILTLIARNYHEAGTGIFTLALTYLAIFYLLSDFGFNAHLLRVKGLKQWPKLLGTRIIWSLILIVIALALLPLLPFATPQFSQAIFFGCLAILGSSVFVSCNLVFQSKLRYDQSVLASTVGTLVSLGLFVDLAQQQLAVPYLLIAHLTGWLVIATTSLLLVRKFVSSLTPQYDLGYSSKLFKDSWPIAVTLLLNVVYFRADAFILAVFKSNIEVGIYNLAYSFFQTALVLPTFMMNAYYPMLLKSAKGIRRMGLILLLLGGFGTGLTYLLAPFIIHLTAGGGFAGSVQSLQILSAGFPAFFLSSLLMWWLIVRSKYKTVLVIYLIGLLFNFSLNWLFIPQYSFFAASWITVISEYLILAMQTVILVK